MNTISKKSSAASPDASVSNEARTGLLIVASLATLIVLLVTAGKFQLFTETYDVPIQFNYSSGLEKNAPVQYAGHKVGRVSNITFLPSGGARILVTASLRKDVRLKQDSQAYIDILGFMGEKFLELSPGSDQAPPLREGQALRGSDPVAMMKVVKQGTELLEEFEKTTDSMKRLLGDLQDVVGDNKSNMNEIFDNLNAASKNLNEMTQDLKAHPWKLLKKTSEKKHFLFF